MLGLDHLLYFGTEYGLFRSMEFFSGYRTIPQLKDFVSVQSYTEERCFELRLFDFKAAPKAKKDEKRVQAEATKAQKKQQRATERKKIKKI